MRVKITGLRFTVNDVEEQEIIATCDGEYLAWQEYDGIKFDLTEEELERLKALAVSLFTCEV